MTRLEDKSGRRFNFIGAAFEDNDDLRLHENGVKYDLLMTEDQARQLHAFLEERFGRRYATWE
jgi:hypothetical protein